MKEWLIHKLMWLVVLVLTVPALLFLGFCLIQDKHAEWQFKRKESNREAPANFQ